ncbi:hypothetical protein T492DRAFT_161058 [Pavlovales sp. CCMP2436]|nr:hypothetical protein T492DRAFT_161058 [Pavlovales sp. CCMP2436]|mmetsp:Transcript_43166/g.106611  ORF Transcript_43166/g.106611 Transcript_43166/m.106611 type:complete len:133 (-) Transcript_43166:1247-1645(-)
MSGKQPRRARGPSTAPVFAELVSRLVARLTRADLEHIVCAHVLGGTPLLQGEIEELLPERRRGMIQVAVAVHPGASREGTGIFDKLDDKLLLNILGRLEPLQRYQVVTGVCKPWRGFRVTTGCGPTWAAAAA